MIQLQQHLYSNKDLPKPMSICLCDHTAGKAFLKLWSSALDFTLLPSITFLCSYLPQKIKKMHYSVKIRKQSYSLSQFMSFTCTLSFLITEYLSLPFCFLNIYKIHSYICTHVHIIGQNLHMRENMQIFFFYSQVTFFNIIHSKLIHFLAY